MFISLLTIIGIALKQQQSFITNIVSSDTDAVYSVDVELQGNGRRRGGSTCPLISAMWLQRGFDRGRIRMLREVR